MLDLFARSGALGLEALSRGAGWADFVENGPEALHALKANVATLRKTKRARIFKHDAIPFAFSGETGMTIYRASVARANVPSESIGKAGSRSLQR